MKIENATIDMRWFAHRSMRSLMVFEIVVNNTMNDTAVSFQLSQNQTASTDFNLTPQTVGDGAFWISCI
jgi:hypothetical protein